MPAIKHFSSDFCPLESAQNLVRELESVLDEVIFNGRSDSVILCGPSGCGKSTIVQEALLPYLDDKKIRKTFQCVHVDGATHIDLNHCVDSILVQLTEAPKLRPNGTLVGSVADKLKELCDALADLSQKTGNKAVIFIIDRLENFVDQRNQLLLYSLFDSARSQEFPICVIGLSTVLDVLEKMEKRVKSRFSQRVMALASTLFATIGEFNQAVRFALERKLSDLPQKEINSVVSQPSGSAAVKRLYEYRKDWQTVHIFVELVAACLSTENTHLDASSLDKASQFFFTDTSLRIICDLPHLHLAVLLCCFEFVDNQQESSFNYNMIQEVYLTTVKQKFRSLKFAEQFVCNAFSELEDCGLLRTVTKGRSEPRQYKNVSLGVLKWQLRAAVKEMDLTELPTDLRQWCMERCK